MIRIRKATLDDVKEMVEIEKTIFLHSDAFTEEDIKKVLDTSNYSHVAVNETGIIVGDILARVVDYSDYNQVKEILGNSQIFTITGLGVITEVRRQRIATQLMQQVMSDAVKNKIKRIILFCRKSNIGAIELYKKLGFQISVPNIQGIYEDPDEDALLMELCVLF